MMNHFKKSLPYILSFFLPLIVVVLAYFNQGIYLGSANTILIYDMRAQLLALYGYLSNLGPGYDNLFYSMSGGLGGGFFGTLALYISPLDLVYSLVPTRLLPDAIYIMTIVKIALCGLACSVFLKKNKVCETNNVMTVTLSCCYSLMTYNFMYAMSPMWLDAVILLPLLALALEKIIFRGYSITFILLMSVCIISNYYMGYMCAIALIIYFGYRVIENGAGIKDAVNRFLSFALHGFFAAGLSAFVIVPVIMDFRRGKLSEDLSRAINNVLIKNSIVDIFKSFAPQSYATLDYTASPNIFCGSIVLVLSLLWIVYGKKNIRARIASLFVITVYFISFSFGPVDRVWHGFRDPVGFPVRYAFTFVFFMICFASRGYKTYKISVVQKSNSLFGFIGYLFVFYTFIELYINGGYILSRLAVEQRYANRNEYNKICEVMNELIPETSNDPSSYGRIAHNFYFSRFDGALYGFDGFDRFSSSYNYALDGLFNKIGIGASYHTVTGKGINTATASLFDIKYFISYYKDTLDDFDLIKEYSFYKLYVNKYSLPLAFSVDVSVVDSCNELGEDPFENINIIFNDLSCDSSGMNPIFRKIEYSRTERNVSDYYMEDTVDSVDFLFESGDEGRYYFYSDDTETVPGYDGTWKSGEFSSRQIFADSYIDGIKNDTFRNDSFSYITGIGYMPKNTYHVLTLDSSLGKIGETWIYYFDDSAFQDKFNTISENGFELEYIGSKGIKAFGELKEDGYIFLSIPYEDGYHIFIDGASTEYIPYRDSLLLVPAKAGVHELVIKYVPPGLYFGLSISIISLCIIISLKFRCSKGNKKR